MAPCLSIRVPAFLHPDKSAAVVCRWCGFRGPCPRNGGYRRYVGEQRRRVQRYLCRNPDCPVVTFSVLPIDALPILRLSLGWMWLLAQMAGGWSVNRLADLFECGRATIRRRLGQARRLLAWILDTGSLDRATTWSGFCGLISHALFPRRSATSTDQHNLANCR